MFNIENHMLINLLFNELVFIYLFIYIYYLFI